VDSRDKKVPKEVHIAIICIFLAFLSATEDIVRLLLHIMPCTHGCDRSLFHSPIIHMEDQLLYRWPSNNPLASECITNTNCRTSLDGVVQCKQVVLDLFERGEFSATYTQRESWQVWLSTHVSF